MADKNAPKTSQEALEWAKDAVRHGRVSFATTENVERLEGQIQRILDALGFSNAWVSDQSVIADFDLSPSELKTASKALGVKLTNKDYLWEVALRLVN